MPSWFELDYGRDLSVPPARMEFRCPTCGAVRRTYVPYPTCAGAESADAHREVEMNCTGEAG